MPKTKNENIEKSWSSPLAFKVYNVNEYNLFKNKEEGISAYKDILMDLYGVVPYKGYFDGKTSSAYIKIIDPNRILSKKDIDDLILHLKTSKHEDYILTNSPVQYYDIEIIASGKELDAIQHLSKHNSTEYRITIKDMLVEKEGLVFKEPIEILATLSSDKLEATLRISDVISPVLLKKLSIENKGKAADAKVVIEDWKTIVESVAIDFDYDGSLFSGETFETASKKTLVPDIYHRTYQTSWNYNVAIKLIDILGEERFVVYPLVIG